MNDKEMINAAYQQLKNRTINPGGEFDNAGRFYATHAKLFDSVREPSRAYPYSQMQAARAKKNVKRLYEHFNPAELSDLLKIIQRAPVHLMSAQEMQYVIDSNDNNSAMSVAVNSNAYNTNTPIFCTDADRLVRLIQDPYQDTDQTYKALAADSDGNLYDVTWQVTEQNAEVEENACDWDDYTAVERVK